MKLKILIIPLLILAIIVFSIWFLAPAYFSVKDTKAKLDEVVAKNEDIKNKLETAKRLNQELLSKGEEQKIISVYLPENKEEEGVINYFDDLVRREGMLTLGFALASKENLQSAIPLDPLTGMALETSSDPSVQYMNAKFKVLGTYEKIRDFMEKLSKLKRFNEISTLKISKDVSSENESGASSGLIVEATAGFGYLEKIKNISDIDNKALISGKFDLSTIDYIKSNKNTEISELTPDAAGKANPFMP